MAGSPRGDDLFTVFGKIDLDQKLSLLSDAIEAFPENKKGFVELLQGLLKEVERVVGCEHLAKRLEGIVEKANAENSPSPSVIYHSDEFQLLVQFLKQGDKSFKISCIKAYAFQPGIDAFWKDERVKAASRNEGLATLVSMWKLFAKPENPWAEPDVYELAKQMNRL